MKLHYRKQKKNWIGTIAGVLSIYNKLVFKSGSADLGEMGWWKLQHNFSPAVAAHISKIKTISQKPSNTFIILFNFSNNFLNIQENEK